MRQGFFIVAGAIMAYERLSAGEATLKNLDIIVIWIRLNK